MIEGGAAIVTGTIHVATDLSKEKLSLDGINEDLINEEEELDAKDIYKELKLRGYQYSGFFRSLRSSSASGNKGHIEWKKNWAAFMDNILQMKILSLDTRALFVPIGIRKVVIDTKAHQQYLQSLPINEQCKYLSSIKLFIDNT